MNGEIPDFAVVSGAACARALHGHETTVMELVEHAYRLHGTGRTVNPPSYFLRFPDAPANRIIALPAAVGGDVGVAGLKWISSFPGNVGHGIPRASAALILNDLNTGYPVACLESSIISAARTAGSAALAAKAIGASRPRPTRLGLIGTGLIARYVHTYLTAAGFRFDRIAVHDLNPAHAAAFLGYLHGTGTSAAAEIEVQAEDLIRTSDLVVFATTAGTPHVTDAGWFAHHPLVLHLSLRDLAPQVILESVNVVDDVDHCLQANTSVHLVAQQTGSRAHIDATLYEVLTGAVQPPADRTVVFSPFGLGVLDLVVANHVHRTALSAGDATVVGDFFHERHRYDIPATAISAESPA